MKIAILVTGEARFTEIGSFYLTQQLQKLKSHGIESDVFVHSWNTVTSGRISEQKLDSDQVESNYVTPELLSTVWNTDYVRVESQQNLISNLVDRLNLINQQWEQEILEFEEFHDDHGLHFPFLLNNKEKIAKLSRTTGQMLSASRAWTLLKDNSETRYDLVYKVRHDSFHPNFENIEFQNSVLNKLKHESESLGNGILVDYLTTHRNRVSIMDWRFASEYDTANNFYTDVGSKVEHIVNFKNKYAKEFYTVFRRAGLPEQFWLEIASLSNVSMTSSIINLTNITPSIVPSLLLRPGIELLDSRNITESQVKEVAERWARNQG